MGNSYLEAVSKVIKEHINDQKVMDQELNALKARQGTSLCDQATMTELLRQEDPNYHYNPTEEELEKKYLLSEDARNAIIDSEKVRYDPVITELTARLNPSRESIGMYLYAMGCMGQAGKNMMQEYLNAVRDDDNEAILWNRISKISV